MRMQVNRVIASRLGPPGTTPSLYVYTDSQGRVMLRPWSDWGSRPNQPCRVAFRVLMWLCWGPPPEGHIACHMACDHHGCLNPTDRANDLARSGVCRYYRPEDDAIVTVTVHRPSQEPQ